MPDGRDYSGSKGALGRGLREARRGRLSKPDYCPPGALRGYAERIYQARDGSELWIDDLALETKCLEGVNAHSDKEVGREHHNW